LLFLAPQSDLKVRLIVTVPFGNAFPGRNLFAESEELDQAIALTVMFATFLIPSGWVLAHMEDYKRKPSE
uniref:Cytochrome c oxidase subunit 8A, mitochondrial n=1 Tax=Terrapene triunguis TaxID=2587831 RepID=A0A674JE53_9SAUR